MQRRVRMIWLSVLAALLAGAWLVAPATVSWADGGHGHHKHPDAAQFIWHVLKAKDALGLDEEQQARLRTIAVNFKKEKVKKTAEVELAEIELHELLHPQAKQADAQAVEGAVRKMYALKADRRLASIKAWQEARAVLSPDQQKKLRELREQREQRRAMHGGGAGHDGYSHRSDGYSHHRSSEGAGR